MKNNNTSSSQQRKINGGPTLWNTKQIQLLSPQQQQQQIKNSVSYKAIPPINIGNSPLYKKSQGLTKNMRQSINAASSNLGLVQPQQLSSRNYIQKGPQSYRVSRSGQRENKNTKDVKNGQNPKEKKQNEQFQKNNLGQNFENFEDHDEDNYGQPQFSPKVKENIGIPKTRWIKQSVDDTIRNSVRVVNHRQAYHFQQNQEIHSRERQTHQQIVNQNQMKKYMGTNEKINSNSKIGNGPKKLQIQKLKINHLKSRDLSDDEPDVPDAIDSFADFSDSISVPIGVNQSDKKLTSIVMAPNQLANKQMLRQKSANQFKINRNRRSVISHEVSSGGDSDEDCRYDQQANIISQVQNNIIQKKDDGKPKQNLKDRNLRGKPKQKDYVSTPSYQDVNISRSFNTIQTPVQLDMNTPKPQPKPFNPPRQSFIKLKKVSQLKGGDNAEPEYNKGKTKLRNLTDDVILGDSDFSEEPIAEDNVPADLSEVSSVSSHSNNTRIGKLTRPNNRFQRVRNSVNDNPKTRTFGRKSTIDADKTVQMLKVDNYEKIQIDESYMGINEIHASAHNSRLNQGSLNFRNKIERFNQNLKKTDDYQTLNQNQNRKKLGKTASHQNFHHLRSQQVTTSEDIMKDDNKQQIYYSRHDMEETIDLRFGKSKNNDESCDAMGETIELNSVATYNYKVSAVSINRKVFELSMKLQNLTEIPESKIKGNQQLKILDLSHNKIGSLPFDLFWYVPNIIKIVLDYNEIQRIHIGVGDVQKTHKNQSYQMNQNKIYSQLSKLQIFSVANNKLNQFPIDCFIKTETQSGEIISRQQYLQQIQLNDNNINNLPVEFEKVKQVKSLLLHSNPINKLPKSLHKLWYGISEFSIDWLMYIQPQVGKILRYLPNSSASTDETSEVTRFDKRNASISQVRNQSFIKGINNTQIKKQNQNERIKNIMLKFGRMLDQFAFTKQLQDKSYVRFLDFMVFFMRKKPNMSDGEVIKSIDCYQKERTLLHQLTEDNQLSLIKDILSQNQYGRGEQEDNIKFINQSDQDNSTALVIALKSKFIEISDFYLQTYGDHLDILVRSRKLGNAINLAIKCQQFTIIDSILNHHQIKSNDSHVLNYIIPNFEKNPTENAKFMVKLILEKGMDPNYLREKYLKKDMLSTKDKKENMPEKILDLSPISLACMKYQNVALNFLIKFNNTIREIIKLKLKVQRQHSNLGQFSPTGREKMDPYRALICQLDQGKQARVMKFFTYIEDISTSKGISKELIIDKNLKLFDFNLKSGPNAMHPLHFAVQANNVKAIEKLKRIQTIENIDFFERDGINLDFPQEFAAPSAPIYKIVMRAQKNIITRKYIEIKTEQASGFPFLTNPLVNQFNQNTKTIKKNQLSIGQSFLEQMKQSTNYIDNEFVEHRSLHRRKTDYVQPKFIRQSDQLVFNKHKIIAKNISHDPKHYFDQVIQKNIELVRNQNNGRRDTSKTQKINPRNSAGSTSMQYKPFQIQQKTNEMKKIEMNANEMEPNVSHASIGTIAYNYSEKASQNNNQILPNNAQYLYNTNNDIKGNRRQSQQQQTYNTIKNPSVQQMHNNGISSSNSAVFQQLINNRIQIQDKQKPIFSTKNAGNHNRKISLQMQNEINEMDLAENFNVSGDQSKIVLPGSQEIEQQNLSLRHKQKDKRIRNDHLQIESQNHSISNFLDTFTSGDKPQNTDVYHGAGGIQSAQQLQLKQSMNKKKPIVNQNNANLVPKTKGRQIQNVK